MLRTRHLEISYRNAAGTIPKDSLMQSDILRTTLEIRLFCFAQQTLRPSTPAIGVTWKYRAEMIPVQYRSEYSYCAIYCELLAKSGFLCCSAYYEYRTAWPAAYRPYPTSTAAYSYQPRATVWYLKSPWYSYKYVLLVWR